MHHNFSKISSSAKRCFYNSYISRPDPQYRVFTRTMSPVLLFDTLPATEFLPYLPTKEVAFSEWHEATVKNLGLQSLKQDRFHVFAYATQSFLGAVGATPGSFNLTGTVGTWDPNTDRDLRPRLSLCKDKLNGGTDYIPYFVASSDHHSGQFNSYSAQRYWYWRSFMKDISDGSGAVRKVVEEWRVPSSDDAHLATDNHCP